MRQEDIVPFFEKLAIAWPTPKSELEYVNPYTLLVAVVLSAQSTDKRVNRATESLFNIVKTPQEMLVLGEEKLISFIKTIGLYRNKAKNIMKLSERLIQEYGGNVPESREALMTLPGVGRKTANVVLNVAFGCETFAVDTHIFRVANRTGLAFGKTPEDVERILEKIVPRIFRLSAHHLLILHGRYTCMARKPKCYECPVYDFCAYSDKVLYVTTPRK